MTVAHMDLHYMSYNNETFTITKFSYSGTCDVAIYTVDDKTWQHKKSIINLFQKDEDLGHGSEGQLMLPISPVRDYTSISYLGLYPLHYQYRKAYMPALRYDDGTEHTSDYYEVNITGIASRGPTRPGSCGAPYLTYDKSKNARRIVGIHIAANPNQMFFTTVTQELIKSLIEPITTKEGIKEDIAQQNLEKYLDVDLTQYKPLTLEYITQDNRTITETLYADDERIDYITQLKDAPEYWPLFDDQNPDNTLKFIGYDPKGPCRGSGKSSHIPTPWSNVMSQFGVPNESSNSILITPAVTDVKLMTSDVGNKSILFTQLGYMNDHVPISPRTPELLERVAKEYAIYLAQLYSGDSIINSDGIQQSAMRPLTPKEMYNGILDPEDPLFGYLDKIDVDASAGFWATKKYGVHNTSQLLDNLNPDKNGKKLYKFTKDPRYKQFDIDIRAAIKLAAEGKRFCTIFKDCLKDELLPNEKIETLRSRNFQSACFIDKMVGRYYYGRMQATFSKYHRKASCQKGIDVETEFTDLIRQWRQVGCVGECGDFKRFDKHLLDMTLTWAIWVNTQIIVQNDHSLADLYENVRKVITRMIVRSVHYGDRYIYMATRGNKSGCPMTTETNSTVGDLMDLCCMYAILEDFKLAGGKTTIQPNLTSLLEHVCFKSLGDDRAKSMSPEAAKLFTFETQAKYMMSLFGIEYTLPSKKNGVVQTVPLEDFNFLSCEFLQDETDRSIYHAALKHTSIDRQLHWMTRITEETVGQTLDSVLAAAIQHDEIYYNKILKCCQYIAHYCRTFLHYNIHCTRGLLPYAQARLVSRQRILGEELKEEQSNVRKRNEDLKTDLGPPQFYFDFDMFNTTKQSPKMQKQKHTKPILKMETMETEAPNFNLHSDLNISERIGQACLNLFITYLSIFMKKSSFKKVIVAIDHHTYNLIYKASDMLMYSNMRYKKIYNCPTFICESFQQAHVGTSNPIPFMEKYMSDAGFTTQIADGCLYVMGTVPKHTHKESPKGIESGDTTSPVMVEGPEKPNMPLEPSISGVPEIFKSLDVTGDSENILTRVKSKYLVVDSLGIKTDLTAGQKMFLYTYNDLYNMHPYLKWYSKAHYYGPPQLKVTIALTSSQVYIGQAIIGSYLALSDSDVDTPTFDILHKYGKWKSYQLGTTTEYTFIMGVTAPNKQVVLADVPAKQTITLDTPVNTVAGIIQVPLQNPVGTTPAQVFLSVWIEPVRPLESLYNPKRGGALFTAPIDATRNALMGKKINELVSAGGIKVKDVIMHVDGKFSQNVPTDISVYSYNMQLTSNIDTTFDIITMQRVASNWMTGILSGGISFVRNISRFNMPVEDLQGNNPLERLESIHKQFFKYMQGIWKHSSITRAYTHGPLLGTGYYIDPEDSLKVISKDVNVDCHMYHYTIIDYNAENWSGIVTIAVPDNKPFIEQDEVLTNLYVNNYETYDQTNEVAILQAVGDNLGSNFCALGFFVKYALFPVAYDLPRVNSVTAVTGGPTILNRDGSFMLMENLRNLSGGKNYAVVSLENPSTGYPSFTFVANLSKRTLFTRYDGDIYGQSPGSVGNLRISKIVYTDNTPEVPSIPKGFFLSRITTHTNNSYNTATKQGNVLGGAVGGLGQGIMQQNSQNYDWRKLMQSQEFQQAMQSGNFENMQSLANQQMQYLRDKMANDQNLQKFLSDQGMTMQNLRLQSNADLQKSLANMSAKLQKELQEKSIEQQQKMYEQKMMTEGLMTPSSAARSIFSPDRTEDDAPYMGLRDASEAGPKPNHPYGNVPPPTDYTPKDTLNGLSGIALAKHNVEDTAVRRNLDLPAGSSGIGVNDDIIKNVGSILRGKPVPFKPLIGGLRQPNTLTPMTDGAVLHNMKPTDTSSNYGLFDPLSEPGHIEAVNPFAGMRVNPHANKSEAVNPFTVFDDSQKNRP